MSDKRASNSKSFLFYFRLPTFTMFSLCSVSTLSHLSCSGPHSGTRAQSQHPLTPTQVHLTIVVWLTRHGAHVNHVKTYRERIRCHFGWRQRSRFTSYICRFVFLLLQCDPLRCAGVSSPSLKTRARMRPLRRTSCRIVGYRNLIWRVPDQHVT